MNGEKLYGMWQAAMANERVDVDGWELLGEVEQNAWDEVALALARGEEEIDTEEDE